MKFGTAFYVLVFLYYGPNQCNGIPLQENRENLRLRLQPEMEPQHLLQAQQRFSRQSEHPEAWIDPTSGAEPGNLRSSAQFAFDESALAYGAPVDDADNFAQSIDPVQVEMESAVGGNVKEKRCRPRYEPSNSILGSTNAGNTRLNIVRRDIPTDIVRRRCEACRNSPKCKNLGTCELCDRICKPFEDPSAINTIDALNIPMDAAQDQTVAMSESTRDFKHGDPTMVALANRQLDIPLTDRDQDIDQAGLSETDDRFYTVGSFGPGPIQSLLARILKINKEANLESLIVLAKTTSAKKPHTIDNPVVIDTAHVFTLNDGKPSPLAMELHPVNADKDVVELTRRLNHDLDKALEHKKKHRGDGPINVHLSAQEIDAIIQRALRTGSANILDSETVGESNPSDPDSLAHAEEEVGCKKKKKDKEDSDEYYSMQPMYYGGVYREADSSEEQGVTDKSVVDGAPKSISSRHGGLDDEEIEADDSDNLRKKKKGKGGKKHHITDSDNHSDDIVGAEHEDNEKDQPQTEEILHVEQDHKNIPMKSDSHTSEVDKLIEHNTHHVPNPSSKEDDSKESVENENERHKSKKGKKKTKKNKKGGHGGDYYGGYRDAEEDPQVGDALQANDADDDAVNPRARSNYEAPMNNQPIQHNQAQYPPENQQYPVPNQEYHAQPQQHQQSEQQYHGEEPQQYDAPALPNSYQPEEGYEGQEDNYQSQETYYAEDSSEEGYDGQDQEGEQYQNYGEGDGYPEPQHEEEPVPQYNQEYQQMPQQQHPQYQEHQATYQQAPQKAEQQYNQQQMYKPEEQQQQYKPEPYPQAQNPVYNHPAPPVEQGTYIPKKSQYNEEPKKLPISPEGNNQYPISQGQENEAPYQEEGQEDGEYNDQGGYEDEEGYGEPDQQEIIIPGLNAGDDNEYIVGKANSKVDEPTKSNTNLAEQYSKILREDLTQGVKLANKTAEAINKRINKIIADSKNLSDKERMAELDEIESAIDNIDDEKSKEPVLGDNLKQFRARFNKHETEDDPTDPTVGAVLQNDHDTFVAEKTPLLDSKHFSKQIAEPIISMANIPSESKSPPFEDPKAMMHQLEVAKMMRGENPERIGCKHKEDSSEEYYRENKEHDDEELKENLQQENAGEEVGCKKKKKKDKESEEEYMVYPQHGYGGYRENQANADRKINPANEENDDVHEGLHGEDEVGCKKKKKDKESEEEIIYVHPPPYHNYGGYGQYRENEQDSDRKPSHGIIVQPPGLITNEEIEETIVGAEQPAMEQSGPSGPFTDEPVDANVNDDVVGCKKKKKKDKESHEEYIYVAPPKPYYNDYGGYRDNEEGADRKKPLEKVREFVEGIVNPPKAAKAENEDKRFVQKVEDTTELPESILPALIEGMKKLRNHHNLEEEKAQNIHNTAPISATTEIPKQAPNPSNPAAFVPPRSPEFIPHDNRESKINAPQQFNGPSSPGNQQFMRPPPNMAQNMRSPIEDNLAMLEAFHSHQNPQARPQQQFFPPNNERVGAGAPHHLLDHQAQQMNHHYVHEDVKFGSMIPAEPVDKIHGVESREVNEKTQMFFVGDGIKLPIHVKKQKDGTMHLSIDVGKLCKCNNVTCTHAVEGLANLVPTLEKLNHGKVELEVNEESFNSALNNLNNLDHGQTMNENKDKSKRSPTKPINEENLNEVDHSDSGELVPVFDDEGNDDISPIKKYYSGDLANDLINLKDNIQMYYENEDKFKEYMGEHQKNKGFLDEFITKRVELLTNVLSWMKSIAIDEARQQQHMDEYK